MRQLIEYGGHCIGTDGKPGPEVVAFESVQAAYTKGRVLMQELRDLLERLTGQEYDLHHVLMSGGSVGAPQYRHRYFPVFARVPFGVDPPVRGDLPDQKTVTYFDAIGDLQGLELTWDGQPRKYGPTSEYGRRLVDTELVTQHVTAEGRLAKAIADVHAGWPAGKYLSEAFDILNIHPEEFAKNRRPEGIRRGNSTYKGLQWPLKVNPNKSGYVQTGGCSREYAHWAEPRFLTIRELTRMMGYPDSWRWPEVMTKASAYVGKCCPVDSGRWISRWVAKALHGEPGRLGQELSDGPGEYLYQYTHFYKKWF
jgi:site-specific DNA-cytosine methylase